MILRLILREVLGCARPLALFHRKPAMRKHQGAGAVQAAGAFAPRPAGWRWAWLGVLLLLALLPASAQDGGAVTGVVISTWDSSPLAGVTVTVRGTTLAAQTDGAGKFELKNVPPGDQVLRFSKSGYAAAVVTEVRVLAGQVSTVNGNLRPEFYELEEYEVTAEEFSRQDSALLLERQSSSALLESIGSERFAKLGAGDAAEIMTKITGVSVVEGKFAVIRGLSDRYNMATLNGADIPSADPYRRAAQLDLFPSEVIDAVVVSKTFTPDLPGGFAGGLMDIRTKSFPEKFVLKFGLGAGYHSAATGNDRFLTYRGSGTDWLAKDDGTRALPTELREVTGTYLDQLRSRATSGSAAIPVTNKTAAAQEMDRLTRSFGSQQMGPTREAPPVDHDFNALIGDTFKLGEVPVGYFGAFNYERDYRFYENGVRRRYRPDPAGPHIYQDYDDSKSSMTVQWSALANVATRLRDDHELGYTFLFVQNAEDVARKLNGRIESSGEDQFNDDRRTHQNVLHWTERNLTAHQFRGGHEFPAWSDLRADWLVSLANTTQDEPDLRYFNFISYPNPADPSGPLRGVDLISNNTPVPDRPTRYFRSLEDDNLNAKFDLTLPVEDRRGLKWVAKAGGFTSQSDRSFAERTFTYNGGNGSIVDVETFPSEYLSGTNAPAPRQTTPNGRYIFSRSLSSVFGNSFYSGQQEINATYGLLEVPVTAAVRLGGGVRYETTELEVRSSAFGTPEVFTGLIDQSDLLPAVNLTWELRSGMNVRLSYAETVARPTYREFARYRSYDVAGDQILEGNPWLRMTTIQNYDARWEWFTTNGGLASFGGFYKVLDGPIEKYNATLTSTGQPLWSGSGDFVTYLNTEEAKVWGLELELRQKLGVVSEALTPFSVGLNAAYIHSEVAIRPDLRALKLAATGQTDRTRPLYDQSPYLLNADVSFEPARLGTTITVVYNYAAERLALISNSNYDIYEQPVGTLDLIISQKLAEHCKLKFTARNLLNPEIVGSYAVTGPRDSRYRYSSYRKGISYGVNLSWEF